MNPHDPTAAPDLEALDRRLQAQLAREASLRGRVAGSSTRLRRGLLLGTAGLVPAWVAVSSPRADLTEIPGVQLWIPAAALTFVIGLALAATTRPLHRAPWRAPFRRAAPALVVLGLALAIGLPAALASDPGELASPRWVWGRWEALCLSFGVVYGLPTFVLAQLVDRRLSRWFAASFTAALGAGAVGMLGLHLHCSHGGLAHLALAHLGVVVLWMVLALAVGDRARAPTRPSA